MKSNSHNYSDWLEGLSTSISSTKCRVGTRNATLDEGMDKIAELILSLRISGGNLWWVGNGGSAAICSHLSQDVLNKLSIRSSAITDASLLTCMANDYGYDEIYAHPLGVLLREGDVLIAISSSGESENIIKCANYANDNGVSLITLSAFSPDNKLWSTPSDVSLYLPAGIFGHAEVGHEALLHAVIETTYMSEKTK